MLFCFANVKFSQITCSLYASCSSNLARVHTEWDEPKPIRHNRLSDMLWTEDGPNSLCVNAEHSGKRGKGEEVQTLEDKGPGIQAKNVWEETFVSHLVCKLEWVERILTFLWLQELSLFVMFRMMKIWRPYKSLSQAKNLNPKLKHHWWTIFGLGSSMLALGNNRALQLHLTEPTFNTALCGKHIPFDVQEHSKATQNFSAM